MALLHRIKEDPSVLIQYQKNTQNIKKNDLIHALKRNFKF